MKWMQWTPFLVLIGCGGTVRSTCERGTPDPVANDEQTELGSAQAMIDELDGSEVELEDGSVGVLWFEQTDDALYQDNIPGQHRTGLPPYNHLLIAVECSDLLTVPVAYTLEVGETVYEGTADLINDGATTTLTDGQLFVWSDGTELHVDVTPPS